MDHLAVAKRVEVAAADFLFHALAGRAGKEPFRHAGIGGLVHEMGIAVTVHSSLMRLCFLKSAIVSGRPNGK